MHWDYILILAVLAVIVPWRSAARIRDLLARADTTPFQRIPLYLSTVVFQWTAVAVIFWRANAHDVSSAALGIASPHPSRAIFVTIGLAVVLVINQLYGVRRVAALPYENRGLIAKLAEKLLPTTSYEAFFAIFLVFTVAICEEFIYRGFVQTVFTSLFSGSQLAGALISAAFFSLAHLYQGRKGLITTFAVGLNFFRGQNLDRKSFTINNCPFRCGSFGWSGGLQISLRRSPRVASACTVPYVPRLRSSALSLSPAQIQAILEPYYSAAPVDICVKIKKYIDLLYFWNRKISLTAIDKEEEVVRFHFGESVFALTVEDFTHGRLADVGSGAGFPGLAIKLFHPDIALTLIEPNKKKCAFLNEVARKLKFSNVDVLCTTFESSQIQSGTLGYVASRALGKTGKLLDWAKDKLAPDGRAVLWASAVDAGEITQTHGWNWAKAAKIPATTQRLIVVGIPETTL